MLRTVTAGIEQRALHTPFRISRGARTAIDLAVVSIVQDGVTGRGEGSVTARYGESVESVTEQLRAAEAAIAEGAGREDLRSLMAPGSARNAVDSALWDLEMKLGSVPPPIAVVPVHTALTLGIDTPEAMAAAARKIRGAAIVKVKVDGNEPEACLRAIRPEVPGSRRVSHHLAVRLGHAVIDFERRVGQARHQTPPSPPIVPAPACPCSPGG